MTATVEQVRARVQNYRNLATYSTTAQWNASVCSGARNRDQQGRSATCGSVAVKRYITSARDLAQSLGETSIHNQLRSLLSNYSAWSWSQISHEMTNIHNAIRQVARAAESGSAADIRRAEEFRRLSVTTGTDARIAAQQQAAAEVAARNARARGQQQAAAAAATRQQELRAAEQARLAQIETQRLAAEEQRARARGDTAAAQRAATARRAAENNARVASQRNEAARRAAARQRASAPQGTTAAQDFNQVAGGIASILNPLANVFANVAQQRVNQGRGQPQQPQGGGYAPSPGYPPASSGSNTGVIVAAAGGGLLLLLILVFVMKKGNSSGSDLVEY
jgi:hypothetical protein